MILEGLVPMNLLPWKSLNVIMRSGLGLGFGLELFGSEFVSLILFLFFDEIPSESDFLDDFSFSSIDILLITSSISSSFSILDFLFESNSEFR